MRSTPMSTVASGAATMKVMISGTRTDVDERRDIDLVGFRAVVRHPRRLAEVTCAAKPCAHDLPRGARDVRQAPALVAADQEQHLRRGVAEHARYAGRGACQVIVDHHRRNGRDEAHGGCQQRFRDAGRDNGEIGGVGFRDADEGVHDPPPPCRTGRRTVRVAPMVASTPVPRLIRRAMALDPLEPQCGAFLQAVVIDIVSIARVHVRPIG